MSTSKHINKICIVILVLTLVLTLVCMYHVSGDTEPAGRVMGYENKLFDTSFVHKIDIVTDDWDSFIETCENEEYTPCSVVIDGESFKNIGIRAKGNTSLSTVRSMNSDRYSFKLEFDQYEDGKNYHGLDKISLNNLIQDNTMMKDYLVYRLMDDFGVDAPLCSYAYITVNGGDWGLYLAVESVEDGFLERKYGADSGELYKPDNMDLGGGRGNGRDFRADDFDFENGDFQNRVPENMPEDFNPEDFKNNGGPPQGASNGGFPEPPNGNMPRDAQDQADAMPRPPDDNLPPTEGEAPSPSGETQIPQDLGGGQAEGNGGANRRGGPGGFSGMGSDDVKLKYIDDDPDSYGNIFDNAKTDITKEDKNRLISSLKSLSEYRDLENTLDTDEVLRYFVVHNFAVNGDSYTGAMIHNYYLHEQDGKLSMIPWDYNLAFGSFQTRDASASVNASIDNPVSGGDTDDRPMVGWIFSEEEYTQNYHDLFREFANRWLSNGKLEQVIRDTQELITPYVEKDPTKFCTKETFDTAVNTLSQFVSLRAEAVMRQLDGDNTLVDTDNLNISDMGNMGGPGGGRGFFPE